MSFPVILIMCSSSMHFLLNWTVAAVSDIWCCSSPTNPWNMISYVNYASNWFVKLLQNGLYANMGNLNTFYNGLCHILLVNYNNNTLPQIFFPFLPSFPHIANIVVFLHTLSIPFGVCASRCAGSRVPLQWLAKYIFNG